MLAAAFFATSLTLAYFASQAGEAPEETGIPDAEVIEQQSADPTLDEGGNSEDNAAPVLEEGGS